MKNLKISVAILVASTLIVSCSKSDVFEQSQSSVNETKMNQYKTSFVQKYGEIAPDQSWDFSTVSNAKASTRAEGEISGVILMGAPTVNQFLKTIKDCTYCSTPSNWLDNVRETASSNFNTISKSPILS